MEIEGRRINEETDIVKGWEKNIPDTDPFTYNAKERETRRVKKRKGNEVHRVKHPTPFQATDALTRDEKRKRTKR